MPLPQSMIYLDYAATTPVDPKVAETLAKFLGVDGVFANPASRSHMFGWQAEAAVEHARKQVAGLLKADTREIVWTSGATEANNLAIKGVAEALGDEKRHIITSQTEHKAVLDCVGYLEGKGFEITRIQPCSNGRITAEQVREHVRSDTALISIMHVNNETGVINDVEGVGAVAQEFDVLFHIDAAQSAGKVPIDTQSLAVDFISVCAHKIYGPKGVGALYVRRKPDFVLPPLIHGGGHERGMRSGTLPTHQIAAMGACFDMAAELMAAEQSRLSKLKALFLDGLSGIAGLINNSPCDYSVPGILNLAFPNQDGQLLLSALPNLAISSGSACTSATMAPSHVLKAMGLSDELALSSLRFSFGRFTTEEQVLTASSQLKSVLAKLG